jgi:hypothetical protein
VLGRELGKPLQIAESRGNGPSPAGAGLAGGDTWLTASRACVLHTPVAVDSSCSEKFLGSIDDSAPHFQNLRATDVAPFFQVIFGN